MTVVRWYHEERLIDIANEPSYTASSDGFLHLVNGCYSDLCLYVGEGAVVNHKDIQYYKIL